MDICCTLRIVPAPGRSSQRDHVSSSQARRTKSIGGGCKLQPPPPQLAWFDVKKGKSICCPWHAMGRKLNCLISTTRSTCSLFAMAFIGAASAWPQFFGSGPEHWGHHSALPAIPNGLVSGASLHTQAHLGHTNLCYTWTRTVPCRINK